MGLPSRRKTPTAQDDGILKLVEKHPLRPGGDRQQIGDFPRAKQRSVKNDSRGEHQHQHQGGEKGAEHHAHGLGMEIAGEVDCRKSNPSRNIQNMPPQSRLVKTTTSDTRKRERESVCRSKVAENPPAQPSQTPAIRRWPTGSQRAEGRKAEGGAEREQSA